MKTKLLTSATIIFISILLIGAIFSCKKNTPLSPARNISGTWTTPFAVTFYIMSDGCGGNYIKLNSTPITMTWTITTIDDNDVDVVISANKIGTTTQLGSNCGLPAPLQFPLEFHGVISSSNLQLTEGQMQYNSSGAATGLADVAVGNFNFTTNNITGTILEKDCPIYCMGYQTDNNKCIVTR